MIKHQPVITRLLLGVQARDFVSHKECSERFVTDSAESIYGG